MLWQLLIVLCAIVFDVSVVVIHVLVVSVGTVNALDVSFTVLVVVVNAVVVVIIFVVDANLRAFVVDRYFYMSLNAIPAMFMT